VAETILDLNKTEKKITMYVTTWCSDCRFAKRWFDTRGIAYEVIDIEKDEAAARYIKEVNGGASSVPTIIFPDGSVLVEPTGRDLAEKFPTQ
jgi:mycoredoxin